jgi:hypothetical protein
MDANRLQTETAGSDIGGPHCQVGDEKNDSFDPYKMNLTTGRNIKRTSQQWRRLSPLL